MTTEELYDLMSKGFENKKTTLTSIDNRLRNVETDVAELKGRRLTVQRMDTQLLSSLLSLRLGLGAENRTQARKL